jgi:hypothetical protein
VTSTRAIFEPFKPRRAEPQAEPPAAPKNIPENIPLSSQAVRRAASKPRRADKIFHRIFPVQPSESPDAQNWFFDRFTHCLT